MSIQNVVDINSPRKTSSCIQLVSLQALEFIIKAYFCSIKLGNKNDKFSNFRIKQTSVAAYSSDALKHKEAPIVDNTVILSDEEYRERKKLENLVSLPKEVRSSRILFYVLN